MRKRSSWPYLLALLLWLVSTMALWGLAFLPSEQTSPEWVIASRNACFGTLASGLPNGGGWIMLVGTPLTFLAAILTVWRQETIRALKFFLFAPYGRGICALLTLLVLAEGAMVVKKIRQGLAIETIDFSSSLEGNLPEGYPRGDKMAPAFEHINHKGEAIALSALLRQHKTVTLSFAFAQCKTVCPMIVNTVKKAASEIDPADSVFVMITLDPWRDTRAAVAAWARQTELPDHAHILTDRVEDIINTLDAYNVPFNRNEKTGDVDHPPLTYVIDAAGKIAYTLGNVPPEWIAQAIKRAGL